MMATIHFIKTHGNRNAYIDQLNAIMVTLVDLYGFEMAVAMTEMALCFAMPDDYDQEGNGDAA